MFSFYDRAIVLTIGNKSERIEFASREEMRAAMQEWLERSAPERRARPDSSI